MSSHLYVFRVRYADPATRTRIEQVKAREASAAQASGQKARKAGKRVMLTKAELVSAISGGAEAHTIYKPGEGLSWRMGARIGTFKLGGEDFVRTDADKLKADNLGEMKEF